MRKLESYIAVDNEPFQEIVRYENESIHSATIANSNVGSPIFFGCTLKQMVFDTCDLNNARFFADCTIDTCTFVRCDLRAVGIGEDEAVFVNCEFISCDMRGMTIEHATFIDCVFSKCKLSNRVLQVSHLVNCTFAGKLIDITFEGKGRSKLQADFENCILDGVEFRGCDLTQSVPPKLKNHVYVDDLAPRIQQALLHIPQDDELSGNEQKRLLRYVQKLEGVEQYIFNTAYMKKIYGDWFVRKFVQYVELDM
ncbi:pentapeptide repeat-containing protein [Paenibacillus wenxiniae]|uniref:Pentapeptide repeat-containing protein n=1 Tax=Paenibacillus wenxiniae TaxID=1636843 RepID=A0ABW4RM28_9BACL